jgi:hypothetical protein
MRQPIKRLGQGDIGLMEAYSYCGTPTRSLNRRWKSGDFTEKKVGPPCMQISSLIMGLRKAFAATSRFTTFYKFLFLVVSGLFGVETESKIFVHIKELGKAGFTPERGRVYSIVIDFLLSLIFLTDSTTKKKWPGMIS